MKARLEAVRLLSRGNAGYRRAGGQCHCRCSHQAHRTTFWVLQSVQKDGETHTTPTTAGSNRCPRYARRQAGQPTVPREHCWVIIPDRTALFFEKKCAICRGVTPTGKCLRRASAMSRPSDRLECMHSRSQPPVGLEARLSRELRPATSEATKCVGLCYIADGVSVTARLKSALSTQQRKFDSNFNPGVSPVSKRSAFLHRTAVRQRGAVIQAVSSLCAVGLIGCGRRATLPGAGIGVHRDRTQLG